jgi:hypothetical protein
MNDMHELRTWLRSHRSAWPDIARRTGVSAKTISRLADQDGYNTTFRTFKSLDDERVRTAAHETSSAADAVLA